MNPFQHGQKILEVGGGDRPAFRPNMDVRPGPTVDIVHDLNQPFPLDSDSYDGIYATYIIEHISWRNVLRFICEMRRVIRPGGTAFVVTSNLLEQCRTLVNLPVWEDKYICMLFGDQNYEGSNWVSNAHHCGFSPQYAIKLFKEAGFESVEVQPHPKCDTDMVIIARKSMEAPQLPRVPTPGDPIRDATKWTVGERRKVYNRLYFDGGRGTFGGYAYEGYWDFPIHWATFRKVMELKPESVLELGCSRGYVLKKLEDAGVRVRGLDVSEHCIHTRVVKDVVQWDITQAPWPVGDNEFDLCISMATLEHVPDQHIPTIIAEINRTCKRGLHGIDFGVKDDGFDKTHCPFKDKKQWEALLPDQVIMAKDDLEREQDVQLPGGDGKIKLNLGSYTTMYHHGWLNMDIHDLRGYAQKYGFAFRPCDVTKGLPVDDGVVDMISANHLVEHLDYRQGEKLFKECRRVLKKGGIMRVATPDADRLIETYKGVNGLSCFDEVNDGCANAKSGIEKLYSILCQGHSAIYNASAVRDALLEAGFSNAQKMGFRESLSPQILRETYDMHPTLSTYVDAIV